jgi:hypothetical protein
MKIVEQVRRERLMQLRQEFKSWVKLNERLGQDARDSTLSQIANESTGSKTSKPKSMGSDLARRIEAVCGKELGWMDTDPDFDSAWKWPFDLVPYEQIAALTPSQNGYVQGEMLRALERLQAMASKRDGTTGRHERMTGNVLTFDDRRRRGNSRLTEASPVRVVSLQERRES